MNDRAAKEITAEAVSGENTKIVGEYLGHPSVALALETYSHVQPNIQEKAAD